MTAVLGSDRSRRRPAGATARRVARSVLGLAVAVVALAAAAAVGMGVTVLVLGRLPYDDERDLVVASVTGVLAAVVLTALLGPRVLRLVVPRAQRSPEAVLSTLGDRASRGVPMEEVLLQLAESLRRVLDLASVEIWTGDGTRLDRLLSVPVEPVPTVSLRGDSLGRIGRTTVAGEGWLGMWLPELLEGRGDRAVRLAPAVHGATVLGLVIVSREPGGERFHDADERTLLEVGRRLGLLLHNRALDTTLQATLDDLRRANDELKASRARLAAASDDVRRRIERDLHDGAQQHLVAIAVNLSLAAGLVEDDPAGARELVERTRVEAREAVASLRDLAHGIYPAQLVEGGLGRALGALALSSPAPLQVHDEGIGRFSPTVEAAAYFCCLEALQNAAKHAPGSPVEIVLREHAGDLRIEVADHGPGMPTGRRSEAGAGQGLQNMIDRLGAVGGSIEWRDTAGGGTLVVLAVPSAERG